MLILAIGLVLPLAAYPSASTPNPGLKYYYPAPDAPQVDVEADIIVYGGTSGGVVAAVQAVRQGNSVALVVFGRHVGGMTSGGLTHTDGVNAEVQGGITREFFDVVGDSGFLPSEAEATFESMLSDPVPAAEWDEPIPTYFEQRLDHVEKVGTRIVAIHMENGSIFRGRMFLDCTYEGDLMAMAGVPYTYGRESQAQYGESLAGRRASVPLGEIDAYNIPGDPESGLIDNLIEGETEGEVGQADEHVQAYNFRMFTTWTNKQPIFKPDGYDAANFEILYRFHKNGGDASVRRIANDVNNHHLFDRGVATDHIGGNRWPDGEGGFIPWWEADYATRELIYQSHVNWQLGMLWYVKTDPAYAALTSDPSVSPSQQDAIQEAIDRVNAFGFPIGEHPETQGWPHELYVREARRMVSDHVTTQDHYDGNTPVPDPVGLANYRADAHHSRRFVGADGTVRVEGDTGGHDHIPWGIPYRALVPPADNTTNLLVPWSISASHVAFCSMRMEPCFMVLSQSASTAAGLAIDQKISVQEVDYAELRMRLIADRQILGADTVVHETEVIVDNADTDHLRLIGNWLTSSSAPGAYNTRYLHDNNTRSGKSATFSPLLTDSGLYEVYLQWAAFDNRASNALVTVNHAHGTDDMRINQQVDGGQWNWLGTWNFDAGTSDALTLSNEGADGYVIADAVRFVYSEDTHPTTVQIFSSHPYADELRGTPARLQILRESESYASPLTVEIQANGTAVSGTHYDPLPASVTIPTGERAIDLWIFPIRDDLPQGSRTGAVHLVATPEYTLGNASTADFTVLDKPEDDWRYRHFASTDEAQAATSAPEADPDHDGRSNLFERYFDTEPRSGHRHEQNEPRLTLQWIEGVRWAGLTWNRSGDAKDLQAVVEYSTSLGNGDWTPLDTPIETLDWDPNSGDRILRQRMSAANKQFLFFRLRVE
nr:FAD-dependent oxidoreductase [Puniceicoccus vermicola]